MTEEIKKADKYKIINELARRRGFYWGSYEIYGGVSGFVTYGFPGARLKQNIEEKIRQFFVNKFGIQEIQAPIIAPSRLFEASGHIENFKEPMVECMKCGRGFRVDHLLREFTEIDESQAEKLSLKEVEEAVEKYGLMPPPDLTGWDTFVFNMSNLPWFSKTENRKLENISFITRFYFWYKSIEERFLKHWYYPFYLFLRASAKVMWKEFRDSMEEN